MQVRSIGYARRVGTNIIGDINYRDSRIVCGTLHSNNRPFSWKLGQGKIELIEFGSFNPKNSNYVPGGKVVNIA